MAGTITSDLTAGLIDAADATGTWTVVGTAWAAIPIASTDVYLQGTAAINGNVSTTAGIATRFCNVTTAAALDLTINERHLYFWMKCFCLPALESRVRGGLGVYISSDAPPTLDSTLAAPWDGPTNSKVWFVSGKDFEPTSGWVCYVVDPTGTPDQTLGTPVMTSVDRAGIRAATLLAVGGGAVKPKPFLWDKMAYGTGLTIIDGTAGTPVTLADIYATDMSVTNSFGVLTQAGGIYYIAGKFLFGTTGQTAVTYFKDTNQVMVFQNFPVATTFYEIKLVGAGSFATTVQLGNYSGGLTSGGVTIRGTSLVERRAIAPVIVSGGTGGTYVVGDILTISGGTFITAAQIKVITVVTGVITVARMETAGKYSVPPTGTLSTTGGGGTGATFTLTFVGGSIWTLTASAANQTLNLYGCTLSEMKSAALANTTSARGCTITNSGTVTSNSATIDSCTFQDLATTTPISATYALIIASTAEMALVTNSKFVNCNRAIKITSSGTYTFGSDTFSGNSYDIENAHANATYASDTVAASASTTLNSTGTVGIGQSFTGTGGTLAGVKFYLKKTGAPTGNAVAKIYTHSGTYGASSVPTGSALATSDNLDVSLLTTTQTFVPLNFSLANNIDFTNAVNYVLTLEYSGGDGSNNIQVGYETTNGHAGNYMTYNGTTWTADSAKDAAFYVFTGAVIIINKTGTANPTTYVNTAGTFDTTSCYSYNANTTTYTDESTDINSVGANDVALPVIQTTTQGDAIYFGNDSVFNGVTLNIGTAAAYSANPPTINWEYHNGTTWTTLTVTDTTTNFTITGTGVISFTPPSDWKITVATNSVTKYWIRARASWGTTPTKTASPLATQGFLGKTTIVSAVSITITVVDLNNAVIAGARVRMSKVSDSTEIFSPTNTGGDGKVVSSYNGGGTPSVLIRVRKSSSGATRYVPYETTQTLPSSGSFSLTIQMVADTLVAS